MVNRKPTLEEKGLDVSEKLRQCPNCDSGQIDRDEVDVGVGVIFGPYGCFACGWSENSEYDLSGDRSSVREDGSAIDQFGGVHPVKSKGALARRLAEKKTFKNDKLLDLIG